VFWSVFEQNRASVVGEIRHHQNPESVFSIFLGVYPTQSLRRAQQSGCQARHARRRRRDVRIWGFWVNFGAKSTGFS
jgi:hypothetical protein